jgi:glycosyltransferase involved in cell wall biosynthesis
MNSLSIPENSRAIVTTEIVAMGGAERSCLALARWLCEQGLPCHFVLYQDSVGIEKFASHPLPVVRLNPEMNAVHKILALRRYFSNRSKALQPLMSGYQTALHGALAGLRGFHCLMHDTPSLFSDAQSHKSAMRKLRMDVSNRTTSHGLRSGGQTIVTSQYLQEESRRVFGVNAAIARMGGLVQSTEFRTRPVTDRLRMLSVSRVEGNKRIDWMVGALASLEHSSQPLSKTVSWQLDVAGKGAQLEQMRTLAKELGVADRIHFHGFVSDEMLQKLYDEADLFLMPAIQGYGIPAIESLQRGIPVLLHRDSGVSDILLDTPWAIVMHGGEEDMAPALSRAIASVRRGRHLGISLPKLPTEDSWAAEVAQLCNWI